ncbi:MAG: DNA primase [Mycoplasmataceae bacterium]|nr:MAG: DNA primase [Mycoplasmataceae bacterium]
METKIILEILTKELGIKGIDKGKSFFFVCPFHNDKNPSLSFEKNEQFFKCFSCDFKAKDIFNFWARYKKISIDEAFDEISSLGYISQELKKKQNESKENQAEKKYLEILDLSANIYQNNLFTTKGERCLEYLKKRGLNNKLIEHFQLGCTISNNQLSSIFFHPENGYSIKYLGETNLFQINNERDPSDFFWGRLIIFPLKNENGKVVSFACRKLENEGDNKYLFLTKSEYFQKSSFVYNYDFVKNDFNDFCYLVEGFFDVISLTKIGINNCISLLGTSISNEQIKILKKLNKKIILFLDGDLAGIEASIKISTLLILNDIECEIIDNKGNDDPDDICKRENEIFDIIKKKRIPFLFIIKYYYEKLDVREDPQKVKTFISKIALIFNQFRKDIQEFIIRKLSVITGLSRYEVEFFYYKRNNYIEIKNLIYDEETNKLEESIIYNSCRSHLFWSLLQLENFIFKIPKNISMYNKVCEFYSKNLIAENYEYFEMKEDFVDLPIFEEDDKEKERIFEKIRIKK